MSVLYVCWRYSCCYWLKRYQHRLHATSKSFRTSADVNYELKIKYWYRVFTSETEPVSMVTSNGHACFHLAFRSDACGCDTHLQFTNTFCYLGLYIDSSSLWTKHISILCAKVKIFGHPFYYLSMFILLCIMYGWMWGVDLAKSGSFFQW